MKVLTSILIGLLVVGCGKKEEEQTGKVGTTLEFARQPFLGIYESEDNRDWVYRFVLKEDGRYQCFANGLEMEGGTWKVVGKEVHVDGSVYTLNADNGLVNIAMIGTGIRDKGTREDYPTKEQSVFKKIKAETQPKTFKALKEEDVVGTYTRKYKDEEGAEILEKKIFRENGLRDRYVNAEKAEYTYPGVPTPVAKWKIKGSEIWVTHVFTTIYKLEQNGDLTEVGGVFFGQLTPHTIKERTTYKKIK